MSKDNTLNIFVAINSRTIRHVILMAVLNMTTGMSWFGYLRTQCQQLKGMFKNITLLLNVLLGNQSLMGLKSTTLTELDRTIATAT